MPEIYGREYLACREREDGELEYYLEDRDEWYTKEEIKEENIEIGIWDEWADKVTEENGGLDWPG
mgnify:CR=1 FL=1